MKRARPWRSRLAAIGLMPVLWLVPLPAFAASVSANGLATATIVRPLSVTAVADMDFGAVTHLPGVSGTVTVVPGVSGASFAGGASAVCSASDCQNAHAARFAVTGEPQRNYAIQTPGMVTATGTTTATGSIAPPLIISKLSILSAAGASAPELDAAGKDSFEVGGTITLPADLPPARYHASFAVIVSYI